MTVKFSVEDQIIARSLSRKLKPRQRKAIVLRFWHSYSIFEVAKTLGMTWEQADRTIKDALAKLKHECAEQPHFSGVAA
ncbi:MAG: sigma factor-like helix-turn-helix DNA-binding protein [Pseudomonadota bacterium]|nr:sigma factor-like helix-turn-helix DNA-binding protein [Pseudomonadota bacterium]